MSRQPHRTVPNRDRELRERAWALAERRLAGRVICRRCRATLATYADHCAADGQTECEGACTMRVTLAAARRDVDRA